MDLKDNKLFFINYSFSYFYKLSRSTWSIALGIQVFNYATCTTAQGSRPCGWFVELQSFTLNLLIIFYWKLILRKCICNFNR